MQGPKRRCGSGSSEGACAAAASLVAAALEAAAQTEAVTAAATMAAEAMMTRASAAAPETTTALAATLAAVLAMSWTAALVEALCAVCHWVLWSPCAAHVTRQLGEVCCRGGARAFCVDLRIPHGSSAQKTGRCKYLASGHLIGVCTGGGQGAKSIGA